MRKFFLLPFIFLFLSAMNSPDEEKGSSASSNMRISRENSSFEDLSEYSSETIENANAAFWHGENGEFDQLENPYSMQLKNVTDMLYINIQLGC